MPYRNAALNPADTARPPPSATVTDSRPDTRTSTPTKPTISPAMRVAEGRSRSQTNATNAPKSGAVELSTAANPAVTDRTANANNVNGMAELMAPSTESAPAFA